MPCCCHCCHCSSAAACGSGCARGGGGGATLLLVIAVVVLLLACPPCLSSLRASSFHFSPPAALFASHRSLAFNTSVDVWYLFVHQPSPRCHYLMPHRCCSLCTHIFTVQTTTTADPLSEVGKDCLLDAPNVNASALATAVAKLPAPH